jgi:hypothetical protein
MFFYRVKKNTELEDNFKKYALLKYKSDKLHNLLQKQLKFENSFRYAEFLVGGYNSFSFPIALSRQQMYNFKKNIFGNFTPIKGIFLDRFNKLNEYSIKHEYFNQLISENKFNLVKISQQKKVVFGFVSDAEILNSDVVELSLSEYKEIFKDYEL